MSNQRTLSFLVSLALLSASLSGRADTVGGTQTRGSEFPEAVDLALARDGTLTGRLVSRSGEPVAGLEVEFWRGPRLVAATVSNEEGRFAVGQLRPDAYLVRVDGAVRIGRVWAPGTAPPGVSTELPVVAPTPLVRGQASPVVWQYLLPVGLVVGGVVAIRVSQETAS